MRTPCAQPPADAPASDSRRRFLGALALGVAALACPAPAYAFGARGKFTWPLLDYPGADRSRAGAQSRLAWELMRRTSVEANLDHPTLPLSHPDLFHYPALYMSGGGGFPAWSEDEVSRLRRFLSFGGFLLIDDHGESDEFDQSVRREFSRVFPDQPFERLNDEHVLFKSFYLVDGRPGRRQRYPFVEGVAFDQRTPVVYTRNDLGGAWLRDAFGNWAFPVYPGGEAQREAAFRLGVNVVMYALCTDYKSDQVHIPFILKRRRSPFAAPAE